MSMSQQSGRFPSNHNASFFGSYSSTSNPGTHHCNNQQRPSSSSLKMVDSNNTPTMGAVVTSRVGGGGDHHNHYPSNTSPHSSVTELALMGSASLFTTVAPLGATSSQGGVARTGSGFIVGGQVHQLVLQTVEVNGGSTRRQGPEKYVSDALERSTQSKDTTTSGGVMAASKISSSNGQGGVKGRGSGASKTYTGRATTVFIRFIAGACGSVRGTDGTIPKGSHINTVVELLGLGVEAASKMAKSHGGAVQYMQGCGLMVSFNAASRVLAHESKACAFALGLKTEMDALRRTPLTMHATIVTTPVMSFFAGNKGQLVLTVLGGYMPIHTALHHYLSQTVGDDVSCILISKTTIPNIELHYESRMLGVVGMSPSEDVGSTGVASGQKGGHVKSMNIHSDAIQLVCPRKATESDEWMYELENQTSAHGFTKMIVDTAASGDLLGAMRIVTEHEAAIHNDTLLSRCLHDRIESCIEDRTAFPLHTAPPTKMW